MTESFDELESSIGVPADLLQRAAAARAEADGRTTEAIIAEWSGGEPPVAAPAPAAGGETEPTADAAGLPSAESLIGEALVTAAAEAKGIPASLTERSARARAEADGVSVEQVMRDWVVEAGLATAGAAAAAPAPTTPEPAAPPAVAPASPAAATPAAEEPAAPAVEVLPPTVPVDEAADEEEVERRISRYPAWLAAVLVVIPLLAALYVVVVPNQPICGSAGQLAVDPATGLAANCDGSAFGEHEASNVRFGGEIFAASCAVCHGATGAGGAGPALAGGAVLETFLEGACQSHIEWVTLGSAGWPDATYGAQNKPVAGGMPSFGRLTETELAQVVLYERVALGGEDEEAAEEECGFAEEGEAATG
ncbi:MAG: c-type cytochrome [Acidobacteria bacterium]|nr:c-type cytochrome [Acidobacteriota bacterium]